MHEIPNISSKSSKTFTDLLYKVEEKDIATYWASTYKKRKVSTEDHSSHVHEVV